MSVSLSFFPKSQATSCMSLPRCSAHKVTRPLLPLVYLKPLRIRTHVRMFQKTRARRTCFGQARWWNSSNRWARAVSVVVRQRRYKTLRALMHFYLLYNTFLWHDSKIANRMPSWTARPLLQNNCAIVAWDQVFPPKYSIFDSMFCLSPKLHIRIARCQYMIWSPRKKR